MNVATAIDVLLRSSSSPEAIEEAAQWVRALGRVVQAIAVNSATAPDIAAAARRLVLSPELVAPEGGLDVKCPRCTRVGILHIEAGERIGNCAQCWLGEGVHAAFVPAESQPAAAFSIPALPLDSEADARIEKLIAGPKPETAPETCGAVSKSQHGVRDGLACDLLKDHGGQFHQAGLAMWNVESRHLAAPEVCETCGGRGLVSRAARGSTFMDRPCPTCRYER